VLYKAETYAMSQEPVESAETRTTAPAADAPRRALVLAMIFATGVIFVALFSILYFRWAGAQEPSSAIIVAATPAFDGAEIIVEGVALAAPYRVIIGERREIPFYLDRGSYTLRVVRDAKTIYSGDFVLRRNEGRRIDLAALEHLLPPPAATAPASGPPANRDRSRQRPG
jgi:hypothetical protein